MVASYFCVQLYPHLLLVLRAAEDPRCAVYTPCDKRIIRKCTFCSSFTYVCGIEYEFKHTDSGHPCSPPANTFQTNGAQAACSRLQPPGGNAFYEKSLLVLYSHTMIIVHMQCSRGGCIAPPWSSDAMTVCSADAGLLRAGPGV